MVDSPIYCVGHEVLLYLVVDLPQAPTKTRRNLTLRDSDRCLQVLYMQHGSPGVSHLLHALIGITNDVPLLRDMPIKYESRPVLERSRFGRRSAAARETPQRLS
jgi:hypothetical protein